MKTVLHYIAAFGAAILMASVSQIAEAVCVYGNESCGNPAGTWRHHPGASFAGAQYRSQVYRVIDSPGHTWFVVRGLHFDRSKTGGRTEFNSIFVYDKKEPYGEGAIRPLSDTFPLSDTNVSIACYDPTLRGLLLVYESGVMDIVFDDGRFVSAPGYSDMQLAGKSKMATSVSVDPDGREIYLCGNFGILVYDAASGSLSRSHSFGQTVCWANRIGQTMTVIAAPDVAYNAYDGHLYAFPSQSWPDTLEGCEVRMQPVSGVAMSGGALTAPQQVLPLTDRSFLTLSGTNATLTPVVVTYSEPGDAVATSLGGYAFSWASGPGHPNYRHLFLTEGVAGSLAGCHVLALKDHTLVVAKGVDPDTAASDRASLFRDSAVREIPRMSGISEDEKNSVYATALDGKGWFYAPYKGFYCRSLSEEGVWGEASPTVLPDGPGTAIAHELKWHPRYGMLCRGPGSRSGYTFENNDYDNLAGYEGGRWKPLNYSLASSDRTTLAPLTGMQKFLAIDPANTDWVWSVGYLHGLMRTNMADASNFLMLGRKNAAAAWKQVPGFIPLFDNNHAIYPTLNNFSTVTFDVHGTMWTAKDVLFDWDEIHEYYEKNYVELMYYTADERLAMQGSLAGESVAYPHSLKVPHACSDRHGQLVALRAPGNENRLLYESGYRYNNRFRQMAFIVDHGGTPDDTSDDRVVYLEDIADDRGEIMRNTEYVSVQEDTASGEVWFNTIEGAMILQPDRLFAGRMSGRRVIVDDGSGNHCDIFNQIWVYGFDNDGQGRRWVATRSGLYCLSEDNTRLLGHWDTTNSPLPSDNVVSVAYDHATSTVFVATDRGLCEFAPQGAVMTEASAESVKVWPAAVRPDYKGYLTVSGLDDRGAYQIVRESDGEVAAEAPEAVAGVMRWDLRDADGHRVDAGRYKVTAAGADHALARFVVL